MWDVSVDLAVLLLRPYQVGTAVCFCVFAFFVLCTYVCVPCVYDVMYVCVPCVYDVMYVCVPCVYVLVVGQS